MMAANPGGNLIQPGFSGYGPSAQPMINPIMQMVPIQGGGISY